MSEEHAVHLTFVVQPVLAEYIKHEDINTATVWIIEICYLCPSPILYFLQ